MDTSSASSSFSLSDIDVCNVTTVKQKKKSKYLKRGLSLITKKYKPNIRKISKNNVMDHRKEFLKWLITQENIEPDCLGDKHRDALFKKFVRKWNGNKLPKNYYTEADSLWVSASPQVESKQPATAQSSDQKTPHRITSKVGDSWSQLAVSTPTDSSVSFSHLSFGTFGKKTGASTLRELQAGAILSRQYFNEAGSSCAAAADTGENSLRTVSDGGSHGEESAVFDRGDAKRAGVRRAFTICRTAL